MRTRVWRLKGLTGSEAGTLSLNNARLTYKPDDGNWAGFDAPIAEVSEVVFPWHYFSGGFKMTYRGDRYRFSFVEPHNENADISGGRDAGKRWKVALNAK